MKMINEPLNEKGDISSILKAATPTSRNSWDDSHHRDSPTYPKVTLGRSARTKDHQKEFHTSLWKGFVGVGNIPSCHLQQLMSPETVFWYQRFCKFSSPLCFSYKKESFLSLRELLHFSPQLIKFDSSNTTRRISHHDAHKNHR